MVKRPEADHPREINLAAAKLGWGKLVGKLVFSEILVLELVRRYPGGLPQRSIREFYPHLLRQTQVLDKLFRRPATLAQIQTVLSYLADHRFVTLTPVTGGTIVRITDHALGYFAQPLRVNSRSGVGVDSPGGVIYHQPKFERTNADE